jgi:hypothetical protein
MYRDITRDYCHVGEVEDRKLYALEFILGFITCPLCYENSLVKSIRINQAQHPVR